MYLPEEIGLLMTNKRAAEPEKDTEPFSRSTDALNFLSLIGQIPKKATQCFNP
ncbi:MAG: hypothetical protein ABIJ59_09455 [Pseudomonadota bacterium]